MSGYKELPHVTADGVEAVAALADLPDEGMLAGALRYVVAEGALYLYTGSSWAEIQKV